MGFLNIGLSDEDMYRLDNKIPNTKLSRAICHLENVIEELIKGAGTTFPVLGLPHTVSHILLRRPRAPGPLLRARSS